MCGTTTVDKNGVTVSTGFGWVNSQVARQVFTIGSGDPIVGMEDYSRHQQSIIKRYYNNRDDIALQRAQELVTELYLAEGKKRGRYGIRCQEFGETRRARLTRSSISASRTSRTGRQSS